MNSQTSIIKRAAFALVIPAAAALVAMQLGCLIRPIGPDGRRENGRHEDRGGRHDDHHDDHREGERGH